MKTLTVETRNYTEEQYTEEVYKHGFIKAWKGLWEEYDDKKDKWNKKSIIVCQLKRENFLNLGECNDGSPFTSVNQAINVAKGLCNYDDERKLERQLRDLGYKNEDFFKYNSLKDLERIQIKGELLNSAKKNETEENKNC